MVSDGVQMVFCEPGQFRIPGKIICKKISKIAYIKHNRKRMHSKAVKFKLDNFFLGSYDNLKTTVFKNPATVSKKDSITRWWLRLAHGAVV
jgi:hypothetical protein